MALVTTDNKHYKNIADAIRGKIGKTDLFKPEQMADGVGEVYEKGKTDFGYKKSVSGSCLFINDVNSNEKSIDVTLGSDIVTDFSTARINVCNKNLVPFPYRTTNYDNNGITAVMQDDGGILLNGTSTADIYLSLYVGTLFYQAITVWNTVDDFTVSQWLNGAMYVNYDNKTKTTFLYIPSGRTFNDMLVYPQIVLGTELGEFEKGVIQTYTPTADGKIEIDVIHPNMSILPTVRGVTINAEYYADCEKATQNLTDTIISLGGTLDV